ncbi:MAG: hypothetical protein K8R52_09900 [Bacteroidales bacterium]|nr:hypothetical protein [Bacteroidales bacterium]
MDRKKPDLQQEPLKNHPFGLPEGYFESFSERLHQRIKEEESSRVPVRKIGTVTRWLAMAAAILAAALITTSIIRFTTSNNGADGLYPDLALLEQQQVFNDDLYLYKLLDEESDELDEDEAFASQAIEYLAINDVEMDLIFE